MTAECVKGAILTETSVEEFFAALEDSPRKVEKSDDKRDE